MRSYMYATSFHNDLLSAEHIEHQVEFEEGDPRNPTNFTDAKTWAITLTASSFALISGKRLCTYIRQI